MRMPPHDFEPPVGFVVYNGMPVRSDHAATADEWALYCAAIAYPRLPYLLTGGGPAGSVTGWHSTSTSFGSTNTVTIPVLVPPFTKYLQWGVVYTGKGEVRVDGPLGNRCLMVIQAQDLHDVEDAQLALCDSPGPTVADSNGPLVVGSGHKVPTLQDLTFTWRTTNTSWDLVIHGVIVRPWPIPPGMDMNGFASGPGAYTL